MEREILFSGIGGQGVQLAAQVLAEAALREGHDVQLFGSYGGMMRGGNTEATVVVADRRVELPPTVDSAWCALLIHPDHAPTTLQRLREDGLVLVNATMWDVPFAPEGRTCLEVPATELAIRCGNMVSAAMVMLGVLASVTSLVCLESLRVTARTSLPPYRSQHAESNDRALLAGADAFPETVSAAWPAGAATR